MTQLLSLPDNPGFLAVLNDRIRHARPSAVRAVNHELVLLYRDIGYGIVENQQPAGWFDAAVEHLPAGLRAAILPGVFLCPIS